MKDHISVCICTFHRNEMLERLMRNLHVQETAGLFDYSIVVVDNDADGHARDSVQRIKAALGLEIVYGVEPIRTIPAARNHAIRLARGNFVGIIDDDEFPPPDWLITLFRAIRTFGMDGALGPVHPFFERRPPDWLRKGRFCERPVHRTGTLLEWNQTRTGNVLMKKDIFDKSQIHFDLKWKTSGSDQAFFKEAMQAGYRFIAVEEAPVYECVPPERWTRRYYLKRALVHGFNARKYHAGRKCGFPRLTAPFKSAAALFAYGLALPFCLFLGGYRLVKCLEGGGYHLSWLLSMAGIELVKKRDF